MANQKKKILIYFTMVLALVGVLAPAYSAIADEKDALLPPKDMIIQPPDSNVTSPLQQYTDAVPWLSLGSCYLSNKGSMSGPAISSIRPGERIYMICKSYLSGKDALLYFTYRIAKYPRLYFSTSNWCGIGEVGSWCGLDIPYNRAANGDVPTYYYNLRAVGGNSVTKNLNFTVIREGIVNSTRAYQQPMDPTTKATILANVPAVRTRLQRSRLKFNTTYYAYSAKASSFLSSLQYHRPNATLIHSHGSSADGGRINLANNSYVNAASVLSSFTGANDKYKLPAGLFYAAVCEGAKYNTLGNAFVRAGYKAFIGYQVPVNTTRNADFYKYFFERATQPNVRVSEALADARSWALAKYPKWADVATARIIGDGYIVCLGGETTSASEKEIKDTTTGSQEEMAIEETTVSFSGWKEISSSELDSQQALAVQGADAQPEVKKLKAEYGPDLQEGIQVIDMVYRVSYKDKAKGIFLYGVDVDMVTGQVVDQGPLD